MMKKAIVLTVAAVLVGALVAGSTEAKEPASKNPHVGSIRHVVLFKFKATATAADIKKVENAFRALPTKIPVIEHLEWGTNVSPEKLDNGFTHCFFLTFKDAAARDAYLPHPAHKEFGKILHPYLDKVLVIDYVAKE
jgi:hypothetical protein